jgi:anti-sigma factor RsiW
MTHEVIRHLLDDYVTGDLSEDARGPVAEHVAGCEICRSEISSLERIISQASTLPTSIDPPPDAWAAIRSTIERDKQALSAETAPRTSSFWRKGYSVAAAAGVVAVLSSTATYFFVSNKLESRYDAASGASSTRATPGTLAAFTVEENNYLRTASILQDLLDQQQSALAPETVAQLKASLHTIDEAILEARGALARDPANKMLVDMLSANYRQKVDLLRRTTEMTRGS